MVLSADPSLQATAAELSVYMSALWRYEPGLYDLVASFIDFDALEKNNEPAEIAHLPVPSPCAPHDTLYELNLLRLRAHAFREAVRWNVRL